MVDDLSGEFQAMAVEANQPAAEINAVEERPIIDEMIARMQHEQDQRIGGGGNRVPRQEPLASRHDGNVKAPGIICF